MLAIFVVDASFGDPPNAMLVGSAIASVVGLLASIVAFASLRTRRKAVDGLGVGLSTFAGGLGALLWIAFAWLLKMAAAG